MHAETRAHTHKHTDNHSSGCDKGRKSKETVWGSRPRCRAGFIHQVPVASMHSVAPFSLKCNQNTAVPLHFPQPPWLRILTLLCCFLTLRCPTRRAQRLGLGLHCSTYTYWFGELLVLYVVLRIIRILSIYTFIHPAQNSTLNSRHICPYCLLNISADV